MVPFMGVNHTIYDKILLDDRLATWCIAGSKSEKTQSKQMFCYGMIDSLRYVRKGEESFGKTAI